MENARLHRIARSQQGVLTREEAVAAGVSIAVQRREIAAGRLTLRFGFMNEPDIVQTLEIASTLGLEFDMMSTSFFLSRETILDTGKARMTRWRKWLFAVLARNASTATSYFGLPANRVVELGMQVEI